MKRISTLICFFSFGILIFFSCQLKEPERLKGFYGTVICDSGGKKHYVEMVIDEKIMFKDDLGGVTFVDYKVPLNGTIVFGDAGYYNFDSLEVKYSFSGNKLILDSNIVCHDNWTKYKMRTEEFEKQKENNFAYFEGGWFVRYLNSMEEFKCK